MDKLSPPAGIDALVIGAGHTKLILAQLLKLNGDATVVIAANKGIKAQIAQDPEVHDVTVYIGLDTENPAPQWEHLGGTISMVVSELQE